MTDDKREGPLRIGQIFMDKYEVVSLIGQGGHAFVYEARHRFMRHLVALKILHRDGGVSEDMLRRGQLEAQVQKRVQHEGIVAVDDAGITPDRQLYIVMERLFGRSLRDALLELGRLAIEEVLNLGAQIADGLQAAHEHGVIHRDVKPDNVFLTKDNHAKLVDFGIAKVADLAAWATQKDMVLGTIYYMSPEQVLAKPLTAHTDMYSLGVMLIEMLLGEHPVPRLLGTNEPSLYSYTRIIATESLPPLDELDPRIPRYVADLVATLTAKKANARFATMADVAAACRECRARYTAEARQRRISLQSRDLSRPAKASSGVELKTQDSARTAVPGAPSVVDTHDTEPVPQPLSFGGVASDLLAIRREPVSTAAVPSASERPTVWSNPGQPPAVMGASPAAMRTAPLGSPQSRRAPAPQSSPPSPRPLPASASASPLRSPVSPPAPTNSPVVRALVPATRQSSQPAASTPAPTPRAKLSFTLQHALVAGAVVGFTSFGAAAFYMTRSRAPEPSPLTPAAMPTIAGPLAPSTAPPAAVVAAAPAASLAPPIPVGTASPPPPASAAAPHSAPSRALSEVRSGLPFADESSASKAKPAPKSRPTDKMDERLRRLEKDLDQKTKPWWNE